jgi:quinol monooxygenase YgiN
MNGKVTVIAQIRAKPGREQEVKQALLALCGPTRAEKGCINYDLHQSANDAALFLFHENWASKADLDAHSQSPHLQAWRKRAAELLVEPTKATLWTEIDH